MEHALLQCTMNALSYSAQLILLAIGLTLIFGVMHIINFAHGEMYMAGAYGVWLLYGELGWNFFASLLITSVTVAFLGVVIERYILRRFREDFLGSFIASLGLVFILQAIALSAFGPADKGTPSVVSGTITVFGALLPLERGLIILFCAVLVLIMHFFVQRTWAGRAIRATEQDEETARLQGVNTGWMRMLCMGIGTALAALSGGLMVPVFYVNPTIGSTPVMLGFVIIVLGGMGSMTGAILGGLILGFITSFAGTFINPPAGFIASFVILIVILIVRPTGIVGRRL